MSTAKVWWTGLGKSRINDGRLLVGENCNGEQFSSASSFGDGRKSFMDLSSVADRKHLFTGDEARDSRGLGAWSSARIVPPRRLRACRLSNAPSWVTARTGRVVQSFD